MKTNTNPITAGQFMRQITLIHRALCSGVVIFGIVLNFVAQPNKIAIHLDEPIEFIPLLIAIAAFFGQYKLSEILLQKAAAESDLQQKLSKYFTLSIIRYAMLEGAALFAFVFALMFANVWHSIVGVAVLGVLVMQSPNRNKIAEELKLTNEQRQLI